MQNFMPMLNEKVQVFVDQLETQPIDIYRPFYKFFSDSIINTALDTKWNMQSVTGDQA